MNNLKVKITTEHNDIYEGSVMHVTGKSDTEYFGILTEMACSYSGTAEKKYCEILVDPKKESIKPNCNSSTKTKPDVLIVRLLHDDNLLRKGDMIQVTHENDILYGGNLIKAIGKCSMSIRKEQCKIITDEVEIRFLIKKYNLTIASSVYLPVTSEYPIDCIEGIGYCKEWIDEDFNPNGTRICFRVLNLEDEIQWYTATWDVCNNAYSCESEWHQNLNVAPSHFMVLPSTKYLK